MGAHSHAGHRYVVFLAEAPLLSQSHKSIEQGQSMDDESMSSSENLHKALLKSMKLRKSDEEEYDDPNLPVPDPLTPRELREFRAMLQQTARVKWFWATARMWLLWLSAASAAIIWFKDSLRAGLKAFLGS